MDSRRSALVEAGLLEHALHGRVRIGDSLEAGEQPQVLRDREL